MSYDEDDDLRRAWDLAGRQDLGEEQLRLLLADDRVPVLLSLAQNASLPEYAVELLIAHGGEVARWARLNPHAPALVKESLPVREQSVYSLKLYLAERGATNEQIRDVSRALDLQSETPLGDVVRRAASQAADFPFD